MEPTHVLVPLDGSPLSEDALAYALSVFGCQVTVLNVVTPLDAGMSEGGVLELRDERTEPARRRADRHDVDHIAIGGHGDDPNGLLERLLGTVATTVVAEAPITVTVVRERANADTGDVADASAGGAPDAGGAH